MSKTVSKVRHKRVKVRKKRVIPQDEDLAQGQPANTVLLPRRSSKSPAPKLQAGRKRLGMRPSLQSITEEPEEATEASQSGSSLEPDKEEVGRLVVVINGIKHVIRIRKRVAPFIIGRHHTANLVLDSALVSNRHAKIYAYENDTREILVVYELRPPKKDTSTNGSIWNSTTRIHNRTVILNDLDTITLGTFTLTYHHKAAAATFKVGSQGPAAQQTFPSFELDRYLVTGRSLGSGSFSVVRIAIDQDNGMQVACKMIRRAVIAKKGCKQQIETEMSLMTEVDHPNIACFRHATSDKQYVYIFMDLMTGGDLFNYVQARQKLIAAEAKFIVFQLLVGLDYLHNTALIEHRDIKPENIVLRTHGPYPHILLSDFGSARRANGRLREDIVGTMNYWAPECFTSAYGGKALDCWSTGVTFYFLLSGYVPFVNNESEAGEDTTSAPFSAHKRKRGLKPDESSGDLRAAQAIRADVLHNLDDYELEVAKNILNGALSFGAHFPWVDKAAKELIRGLLVHLPKDRYTTKDALRHRFIATSMTELTELYNKNVQMVQAGPSRMSD